MSGNQVSRLFDGTRITSGYEALLAMVRDAPLCDALYKKVVLAKAAADAAEIGDDIDPETTKLAKLHDALPERLTAVEKSSFCEVLGMAEFMEQYTTAAQVERGWTASFQRTFRELIPELLRGFCEGEFPLPIVGDCFLFLCTNLPLPEDPLMDMPCHACLCYKRTLILIEFTPALTHM